MFNAQTSPISFQVWITIQRSIISRFGYNKNPVRCVVALPHAVCSRSIFTFDGTAFSKKKEYTAKKLVGYSPTQMYNIVSDVGNYKHFLPFCKRSDILLKSDDFIKGDLEIGFPPIVDRYVSNVTLKPQEYIKAESHNCQVFDYLLTIWKFEQGLKDIPNTCVVSFYLRFQFKSVLYAKMVNVVFGELVHQMENAFLKEARKRHGKPSIITQALPL